MDAHMRYCISKKGSFSLIDLQVVINDNILYTSVQSELSKWKRIPLSSKPYN